MLSRSLIILALLTDLSIVYHKDTVHTCMYTPLILFNPENILFVASPISCSFPGGNFIICLLFYQVLKRKHNVIKCISIIFLITLLLQCGDIERNPGPLNSKYNVIN